MKKNNFIFPWMQPLSKDDSWWLMMRVRMTVIWAMVPQAYRYTKNIINSLIKTKKTRNST